MSIALIALMWCGAQEEGPKTPLPTAVEKTFPEEIFGVPIHGFLSAKYRARLTPDESDQDLYEYLSLDIGKPEGTVTGHAFIRATEDLDTPRGKNGYYPFDSITDTYSLFNARFYYGYVDLHRLGPVELIRGGRQFLQETPLTFHIDGLRVESKPLEKVLSLQAGLYGGLPVHLFESSARDDYIAGGFVQARPWRGARLRFDYVHIQDEYQSSAQIDNLLAANLRQALGERLFLEGRYSMLNGVNRDFLLRGNFYVPEWRFRVDASYYQLMTAQKELSIETDFFFPSLFEYKPYGHGRLLIAKGFGEHVTIQAGAEGRELWDDPSAPRNREFFHLYLNPVVTGLLLPGLTLSVTGDIWEVPGSDNGDIYSAGFDVTHVCSPKLTVSAGTAFALYQYDYFAQVERERVRTIYGKASYLPFKGMKIDLGYEFERNSVDDFHTIKVGVGYSF